MKIRTDFVTNSSSSNFTVAITIKAKSGIVYFMENPYDHDLDQGGEAQFNGNLREINQHLSSVEDLATWLAKSLKQDVWHDNATAGFARKKNKFINDAKNNIKSVRDIDSIVIERRYSAWGEFADLVADNDSRLCELAEKYINSTGIEKERAKAEMITHINTTTEAEGETFGCNSCECRYRWNRGNLDELAKRLVSHHGPSLVNGVEYTELNLRTGKYYDWSEFDLE